MPSASAPNELAETIAAMGSTPPLLARSINYSQTCSSRTILSLCTIDNYSVRFPAGEPQNYVAGIRLVFAFSLLPTEPSLPFQQGHCAVLALAFGAAPFRLRITCVN